MGKWGCEIGLAPLWSLFFSFFESGPSYPRKAFVSVAFHSILWHPSRTCVIIDFQMFPVDFHHSSHIFKITAFLHAFNYCGLSLNIMIVRLRDHDLSPHYAENVAFF